MMYYVVSWIFLLIRLCFLFLKMMKFVRYNWCWVFNVYCNVWCFMCNFLVEVKWWELMCWWWFLVSKSCMWFICWRKMILVVWILLILFCMVLLKCLIIVKIFFLICLVVVIFLKRWVLMSVWKVLWLILIS